MVLGVRKPRIIAFKLPTAIKIAFFHCEEWEKKYMESKKLFDELNLEVFFISEVLDRRHIPADADFDIISIFVDSEIDKEVLGKLPNLKFISARSTGYDHIDINVAKEKGIQISYVPTYGENTVAEYTFALILALSRKIFDSYRRVREEGSFSQSGLRGFDLKGKTLGVIGAGNIGRNVIRIARGFGMIVIANDINPDGKLAERLGFEYVSLDRLLKVSDIVSLHVPAIKETFHLMNSDTFLAMKKGAYLINTSRGEIVETQALVKALKEGRVGGAALDVLEEEGAIKDELDLLIGGHSEEHNLATIVANHILIDMPNVIVTPHNAFNTAEALQRILDATLENVKGFVKGEPINTVPE